MKTLLKCVVALIACLALLSCGKPNPLAPSAMVMQQGISFSEDKLPISNGEFIYRQGISLDAAEGAQFAYKLSTLDSTLPEGMVTDSEGWLYFNPTRDTSGKNKTIWTTQAKLSLDFYSTDAKLHNLVTQVEARVKAKDGSIRTYQSPFKSNRVISSYLLPTFNPGSTISTGVEFNLHESGDFYVVGLYAHHFMYRLNTLDSDLNVTNYGTWNSSIDCSDIRRIVLNAASTPALTVTPQNAWTQFEFYVVSRQGLEEATPKYTYFRAVAGNKPVAMIYPQTLIGLGENHYTLRTDQNSSAFYEIIPTNSPKKNRQLWMPGSNYYAVNSQDFKLHLRWGYSGQYYYNDPFSTVRNVCLNEQGLTYYSKITAFDLRLDGSPFPTNSGFVNPLVVTHNDGTNWLRVLNLLESCRHSTITNLSNGNHVFEVCAVDLQGVHSEPVSATINLVPAKPLSQRSGILIVDDSPNHSSFSPEQTVDNIYNAMVPSTWGAVSTFDIASSGTSGTIPLGSCLLQDYKAVLWHSDNPASDTNLLTNLDALECYLAGGGNLVLSGTNKLASSLSQLGTYCPDFAFSRLGITGSSGYGSLGSSITNNPFFEQAVGINGLSNVSLETETSFSSIVNTRNGIGAVTYFNPSAGLNFLYGLGCKTVGQDSYSPNQDQYSTYSTKYVAYKHSNAGSNVIVFGFPLSFMEQAEVSSGIQNILGGVLGNGKAKGGAK